MIVDQLLLAATTTGTGTAYDMLSVSQQITLYVVGAGTISGGTLIIETADDPNYSGTWAQLDSVTCTTLTGGKVAILQHNGPFRAIRGRVSSDLSGTNGTIQLRLIGN